MREHTIDRTDKIQRLLELILKSKLPIINDIIQNEFGDLNENSAEYKLIKHELEEYNLIKVEKELWYLTKHGEIVCKNGYRKYLQDLSEKDIKNNDLLQLEIDLAKSNIEANDLNKKNAKNNNIALWINVFFGFINVVSIIFYLLIAAGYIKIK